MSLIFRKDRLMAFYVQKRSKIIFVSDALILKSLDSDAKFIRDKFF